MGIYRLKRKLFTKYDDTDNLKRAKDSDILAEKLKKPATDANAVALSAAKGAALGGIALGAVSAAKPGRIVPSGPAGKGVRKALSRAGANASNALHKFGKGGRTGLIAGAAIGTATALYKRGKEKKENQFYNRRLEYAQRQAMRREKADWKANMTQRDGYSY
jgi:hypothetical protein